MSYTFEVPEEIYNEIIAYAAQYGQTPDDLVAALISAALERLKQAHGVVALHIPSDSPVTDLPTPFVEASLSNAMKTEQGKLDNEDSADDYGEQGKEEEQSRLLTRADIELLCDKVKTSAMLDVSSRNLRGINLSYFDLQGANLREANLRGANLSRADLRGALLHKTNLQGADLSNARVYWSDLAGANLYNMR